MRRRSNTGTSLGVTIRDIKNHLHDNVEGLREHGIGDTTIRYRKWTVQTFSLSNIFTLIPFGLAWGTVNYRLKPSVLKQRIEKVSCRKQFSYKDF